MEKTCPYCQKLFEVKRIDAMYCSRTCRQMAYMNRRITNLIAVASKGENEKIGNDEKIVKTSIDSLKESDETIDTLKEDQNLTIDTLSENVKVSIELEEKYVDATSSFTGAIYDLTNEREYIADLNTCFNRYEDDTAMWVSLRLKCLLECLLLFSDMKTIKVVSLLEICNAFILLVKSRYYKNLPDLYPYKDEVFRLKEKLKRLCLKVQQAESVKFYLNKEDKIGLIAMRYELAQYVPKRKFIHLDFNE